MSGDASPDEHDQELEHLERETQRLQRELDLCHSLFNSLPIGIYRTTADGHVLLANAAVAELLGADPEGGLAAIEEAMKQQQVGSFRDTFRNVLERENEVRGFEDTLNRPDKGKTRYVRENARIIRDEDGTPLYHECTLEDVTERRQAEAALRASEERYRSVVEQSPAGILLVDDQARVVFANDETCYILGRTHSEVVGKPFTTFLHPEDVDLVFDRYVRRQRGAVVPPRYEIRILRPGGDVRYLVLSATAYWDSSHTAHTVAQLLDITERTRAEQALRDYASELEIRNAELDAFADSVAHDLRNPLGTIMGFSETLLATYDELTPEETQRALQSMVRMGHKMDAIIDALLLFARVRKTAVKPGPVDMGPIVQEVLHRLEEMIATHQAEIIVPSHWPAALGYAPWLEEVWANYITNAIIYGGRPPRVELGARLLSHGKVRFWVRDNGDGVSEKRQESLFRGFAQSGHRGGHGLGLSIVRRIVDKLDGDVAVESSGRAGEGSVFSFDLPAALRA